MNVASADVCENHCLNATWLCKSVEIDNGHCYLQDIAVVDVGSHLLINLGNCDSYQRHCDEIPDRV